MEKDYTKRELDMKFENLAQKIDGNHEETRNQIDLMDRKIHDKHQELINFLSEIKSQTIKTNGRVNGLEDDSQNTKAWKIGIGISSGLIIVIVSFAVYIHQYQLKVLNDRIDATIIKSQ